MIAGIFIGVGLGLAACGFVSVRYGRTPPVAYAGMVALGGGLAIVLGASIAHWL